MIRRGPALLRPFLESSGRTGLCWFKRETQPVREIVPALFSGLICCRSRRNKEISEYLHRFSTVALTIRKQQPTVDSPTTQQEDKEWER